MNWDELKEALKDEDMVSKPVKVLIDNYYHEVTLVMDTNHNFYFIPVESEGEEND